MKVGQPLRHLPNSRSQIFLTFDDGPEPGSTGAVLDVLERHQAKATFFLIANKARENMKMVGEILSAGHAIGDHSLDHRYRNYFRGDVGIRQWLTTGENEWKRLGLKERLVGFRPPAGICTPPLLRVTNKLGWPVILWSTRFFDAVTPWTEARALKSASEISSGSIVLLHDRQKNKRVNKFCKVLDEYVHALKARGFELAALPRLKN